jgi:ketosteroid isomerase-like protein
MSSRERNLQALEWGLDAFTRGDQAALRELLDPEIESFVDPRLVNGGSYVGRAGFEQVTSNWADAWGEQSYEIVDATAPDDHHVFAEIHQRATGSGSGIPVEMTVYYMLEYREGLLKRFHIYADRESALAAVG